MGKTAVGATGGRCRRLLPSAHRLYQPGLETARNEPYAVDDCGHRHSQLPGHYSLFHSATSFAQTLSAMRVRGAAGIQLLSSLQLQTDPELPAMQAPGWQQRCILPLLRNTAEQSSGAGLEPFDESLRVELKIDVHKARNFQNNYITVGSSEGASSDSNRPGTALSRRRTEAQVCSTEQGGCRGSTLTRGKCALESSRAARGLPVICTCRRRTRRSQRSSRDSRTATLTEL
jgi:hypothetical protein